MPEAGVQKQLLDPCPEASALFPTGGPGVSLELRLGGSIGPDTSPDSCGISEILFPLTIPKQVESL